MLRFGLVGCGTHARWAVLPAMAASRGCRLAAVADIVPENLKAVEDPAVRRHTDYRAMLAEGGLDAVYVATPCEAHAAPTIAALETGCHVVCEKPMAMHVDDCRRMIAAAESAGKRLAIDFESRYISGNRQVRDWIADGLLGAVRAVHIDHFWDGHKSFGPLARRREGFLQRNGCLDCGIHMLDLARFFCGGGEWRNVRALGAWVGEAVRFPPHIAILASLTTGTIVTLNASFSYTAHIRERRQRHACAILGEKGVITLETDDAGKAVFRLVTDALTVERPLSEAGHGDVIPRLLDELDAVVNGGAAPSPSLATGFDGLMAQVAMDEANADALRAGDVAKAVL